ncbi:MAG: type II toxin-antitoxin system mRNA interferase toxin, RelE/StbE family [Methanofastidiosum sp.]
MHQIDIPSSCKKDIKNADTESKKRLKKVLTFLMEDPYQGKPLRYELKGMRSIRIGKYRLTYEIIDSIVRLRSFRLRKKVHDMK